MNRGFLSPKIAKKAANIPSVDVGELDARMKRLKGDEVEDAGVTQPRNAVRVVATHQEESVPIDVVGTFVQSDVMDTHTPNSTIEQVKPVSLDATDSNGSIGVKVADFVNKENVMDDLNASDQPSATEQPNASP